MCYQPETSHYLKIPGKNEKRTLSQILVLVRTSASDWFNSWWKVDAWKNSGAMSQILALARSQFSNRLNIIWAALSSLRPVWVTCTSLLAVPGNLPQRQMEYFWLCPWALVDLYWYNGTDWNGDVTHFGSSWWWAPLQEFLKAKSALVPGLLKSLGNLQVPLTPSD